MTRKTALVALTVASTLVLIACLVGGRPAELAFAVLAAAVPALLMVVGAADRQGTLGRIALPIVALLLVLEAGLLGLIVLADGLVSGPWLAGVPAALVVQVLGLCLVPLLVIAFGYALTFDRFGVGDDDLERLRRLSRERGEE